ncbi:hypothetical protein AB0395_11820 [Streptosporangium sp. NPDC051023]|uniref:hypothetical protein n=1 Tax=Streptosporangium sp. NPDC051023 TaxID=3155410 RepID=UPI00344DC191
MGSLRPAALVLVGMSLVAACGGGRTATPSPEGSPVSPSSAPGRTARESPSPSGAPTGEVTASAAWKTAEPAALSGSSALLDVTTAGPREAWAVGYQLSAEDREGAPAVVRWDGTGWHAVPGLTDRDVYHLTGVSASGPGDVWVAGNGASAFAARWDGRRWTALRPFGVAEDYRLTDVAAADGTDTTGKEAWFTGNGPAGGVLLEWVGGEFGNVLNEDGGTFEAITAREGNVWAVGSDKEHTPLVWHGDSGNWEKMETPAVRGGTLRQVWQVSPSDVWAVGEVAAESGGTGQGAAERRRAQPLVLHWDGTRWTRVEVPVARGTLHGVTASGPGDLWISGIDADHPGQVLFLHFDGTRWSREYGPLFRTHRQDQQYEESDDVNRVGITWVPSATTLWAVGSVGVGDDEDDFVLRR